MTSGENTDSVRPDDVEPGDLVEVWCPTTGRFAPGFRANDLSAEGVTVSRISDGVVLPAIFTSTDVSRSPLARFNEARSPRTHRSAPR